MNNQQNNLHKQTQQQPIITTSQIYTYQPQDLNNNNTLYSNNQQPIQQTQNDYFNTNNINNYQETNQQENNQKYNHKQQQQQQQQQYKQFSNPISNNNTIISNNPETNVDANRQKYRLKSQVYITQSQAQQAKNNKLHIPKTSANNRKAYKSTDRKLQTTITKLNNNNANNANNANTNRSTITQQMQQTQQIIYNLDQVINQYRQYKQSNHTTTNPYQITIQQILHNKLKQILTIKLKQNITIINRTKKIIYNNNNKNNYNINNKIIPLINYYYNYNTAILYMNETVSKQYLLVKLMYYLQTSLRELQQMEQNYQFCNINNNMVMYMGDNYVNSNNNNNGNVGKILRYSQPQINQFIRKCYLNLSKTQLHLQMANINSNKINNHIKSYNYNQLAYWESLIAIYTISICFINKFIIFIFDTNYGLKGKQGIPHATINTNRNTNRNNTTNNNNKNNGSTSNNNVNVNGNNSSKIKTNLRSSQNNKQKQKQRQTQRQMQRQTQLEKQKQKQKQKQYNKLKIDIDYIFFMLSTYYKITKQIQQFSINSQYLLFIRQVNNQNNNNNNNNNGNKIKIKLITKLDILINIVKKQWSILFNFTKYQPSYPANLNIDIDIDDSNNQIQKNLLGQLITRNTKNINKLKYTQLIKLQYHTYQQLQILIHKNNKLLQQQYKYLSLNTLKQLILKNTCSLFAMSVQSKLQINKNNSNRIRYQQSGLKLSYILLKLCLDICQEFLRYTSFYYQVKLQYETRIDKNVGNQCIRETTRQHQMQTENQQHYYNQNDQMQGEYYQLEQHRQTYTGKPPKYANSKNNQQQQLYIPIPKGKYKTINTNPNPNINNIKKVKKLLRQIQKFEQAQANRYNTNTKNNKNHQRLIRSLQTTKYQLKSNIQKQINQFDPVTKKIMNIYQQSYNKNNTIHLPNSMPIHKKQYNKSHKHVNHHNYNSKQNSPRHKLRISQQISKIANLRFSFKIATQSINKSVQIVNTNVYKVPVQQKLYQQKQIDKTTCNMIRFNHKQQRITKIKNFDKL